MATRREHRGRHRRAALRAWALSLFYPIWFMVFGKSSDNSDLYVACYVLAAASYIAFTVLAIAAWHGANGIDRLCRDRGWDLDS